MTDPSTPEPDRIIDFWFGELDAAGLADEVHAKRWWQKSAAFDAELREGFEADHLAITAGERSGWLESPRGLLAYVIVLDQLSRNMYRGTPRMFAFDDLAQRASLAGIERGEDRKLPTDQRAFLYMPLMHSEDVRLQERCVELFERLHEEVEGRARARVANNLKFARAHRDIVKQWGRFPHRNAILGRQSSAAEREFLEQPGSSF